MTDEIDLDHVAVAAESWSHLWPRYIGDLGGQWKAGGEGSGFASAQVRYSNGMKVEALAPHRPEDNDFLRRFLDHRGPGPHHLTFKVPEIHEAIARCERSGYRPVGIQTSDPMWKEAFIHPKDAPGVVVQLAESAENDWHSPAPDDLPSPAPTAELVHVAHAVVDMDEGLRMFQGLLDGAVCAEGSDDQGRWVDLRWPGPGRVRLIQPAPATAAESWIGSAVGRIHHIAFAGPGLRDLPDAQPGEAPSLAEIPPEDNLGVRLVLSDGASGFAQASGAGT